MFIYELMYLNELSLLGTPTSSRKWFGPKDTDSRGLLYNACREALRHSVAVRLNVGMGITSNFERDMIIGARRAGSRISETADLTYHSVQGLQRIVRQTKKSSQRPSWGWKQLVDERSKEKGKRMATHNDAEKQCAEQHLGTYNSSILVTDGFLQQKTTPGSTPI
jgi:hypothetical protein